MNMKVVYNYGKDLGKSNWRIYCRKDSMSSIILCVENFDHGFIGGEQFDETFPRVRSSDGHYTEYASIITKDKDKIELYRPLVIKRLQEVVKHNLLHYMNEVKRIEMTIRRCNETLSSDLFKDIIRDEKLEDLGI